MLKLDLTYFTNVVNPSQRDIWLYLMSRMSESQVHLTLKAADRSELIGYSIDCVQFAFSPFVSILDLVLEVRLLALFTVRVVL